MDSKRKLENGLEPPAKHQEIESNELIKLFEKICCYVGKSYMHTKMPYIMIQDE